MEFPPSLLFQKWYDDARRDGCIRFMLFHFSMTGVIIVVSIIAIKKTCNDTSPYNPPYNLSLSSIEGAADICARYSETSPSSPLSGSRWRSRAAAAALS